MPSRIQRCKVGHVARAQRPPQHAVGDAVELDEHDAGHVGDVRLLARACARAADARWSVHASSSRASTDEIAVVTMTRPITIAERWPEAVDLDAGQQFQDPADERSR